MESPGKLEIINLDGEVVFCKRCPIEKIFLFEKRSLLPIGSYLVRFQSADRDMKRKLVIA